MITENGTELTSPNYPIEYPMLINCANIIKFQEPHIVRITFLDFDTEKFEYAAQYGGKW